MENSPSTSYECNSSSSGNIHCNIEGKNVRINAKPKVYKQFTINNYFQAGVKATTEPSEEIRNCCTILDSKGNKQCETLKEKLQAFYTTLTLPKVAWIDEGAELSLEEHFVQLELKDTREPIVIQEIFHPIDNKKPRRILIEGQPGYGKTTLATKLTFDWATNKDYINFKLLFFIPLRELQQRTIENAIMKIGERCGYQQQQRINIEKILTRHEEEILFVLDGLDELSSDGRSETMKVLYKQRYGDATVLTSCRTGLFKLTKQERDELFGQTSNSREFWDKRISILGIQSIVAKIEFLKKFISKQKVYDIIQRLYSQLELFNSPLYLIMLPIIIKKEKDVGHFSTRTDLYKKLFNSIVRHTCVKRGILNPDSEFDLFNSNSSQEKIRETMTRFGEQCVVKILNKDLKFEPTDLVKEIYQLGLLINHKQVTFFESKTHYEAFHLSIMEIAAAFALSIHLKYNESALIESSLETIIDDFRENEQTSLMLPFMASLLGSDLDLLLFKIEPFSNLFRLNITLTVQLIAECSTSNISKSKYLKKIIHSHIDLRRHDSVLENNLDACRKLLKYGCDSGKIKQITTDGRILSKLIYGNFTTDGQILSNSFNFTTRFEINVVQTNDDERLILHTCASPNLQEIFSNKCLSNGTFNEYLSLAASPQIESCTLIAFKNDFGLSLKTIMEEKTFKQIKYRYLEISIENEPAKKLVINLLENNQVEHLAIQESCYIRMNLSDFFSAAARSKCLTSFSCASINVDLDDITNGGNKKYNLIELNCCTLTCRQPISLKNCCEILKLTRPKNIEAITEMEPSEFVCSTAEISELTEKCPTWVGFKCVKSLKLIVYQSIAFGSVWRNLQTLHLQFQFGLNHEELIADSIQKSPIVTLVIELPDPSITLNLFTHMNRLWANENKSHLKTITFISSAKDEVTRKEVLELIEGLKCSHWDEVCLELYYYYLLPEIDIHFKVLDDFIYGLPDRFMRDCFESYGYFDPMMSIARTPV